MRKKYYKYYLFLAFLFITGIVTYIFRYGHDSTPPLLEASAKTADSTEVLRLNNEAFNLRLSKPSETISKADSALRTALAIGYTPGIAEAHRVMGVGFFYIGNNALAIRGYLQALKIFRQLKDSKNEARVYNNIGNLYAYNDPAKSLYYLNKALVIAEKLNDQRLLAGTYLNMGHRYLKQGAYEKSLLNFEASNTIFKKLKDTVHMIIYLQNTGRIYHKMNKIAEAKSRLLKAIAEGKKYRLEKTVEGSYLSLIYIYIDQNQFDLAEKTIAEGVELSKHRTNTSSGSDFMRVSYELELKRKNYKKAIGYLASAYRQDSIALTQNEAANIGFNSQYYIQQQKIRDRELIISGQKYKEVVFWWIITSILLFVLILAVVLLYLHIRSERRRKTKEISVQNDITALEHKALQAMMNPHFVFNLMNAVQHFVNQADRKSANQMLSGFANLARKHLEICIKSTISVQEELAYLRLYLSLEKIRFADMLDYRIAIDDSIDTEEICIPAMLIQPFIENAIWHGIMPKENGGTVRVTFELEDTFLLISVIDNGIGILNSNKMKKSGHISRGMALINERITLLNRLNKRHIFIDQHQTGSSGTAVSIRIPT